MGIQVWVGRRAVGAALGSIVLAGQAGAAAGPSVSVSRKCYVNADRVTPIDVSGAGWTPGDTVQLASKDGLLFGTAVVEPSGQFSATLQGTSVAGTSARTEQLSVTDQGNQTAGTPGNGQTATVAFQITNLAVSSNPAYAPLRQKVTFSFSGFRPGAYIYAHYLHRGRQVVRQRFGRASGACGTLRKRTLQYPGGHPRYSSYTVQFDDTARYGKRSTPRYVARLSIL